MKVLFYAAEKIDAGMRLQKVIEARVPADTRKFIIISTVLKIDRGKN